jgi:phosphatidylserine decarboxylase
MVVTFERRIRTNTRSRFASHYRYERPKTLKKGELFGWFEMGSTLVILSEKGAAHYDVTLGQSVQFAQPVGLLKG